MGFTYEAPRNLELADCALDPSTVRPYEESTVAALHRDCEPSGCRFARRRLNG
ncbi:hypothetical protein IU501_28595 [Nocardia otitidiscaviarum]|uniref:hypothetical protein n=1 Tax=Nocardia otitidiscaviarum TaxID=1823 RepID=UPI000A6B69D5|nr:hypothetical protein [Nocardia otitidiscaviarum]MBF6136943.1 hypothetical protein [Nocardia otitidiscaviarum]MBF6239199.1 hypothetical protein [Nocardia otitidiscaviarum]MBF6485145.1 hypothetical protein [Nocardia otitidiscaviarum]